MKKTLLLALLLVNFIVYSQKKGIIYYGYIESTLVGNAKGIDYCAYMTFNKDQSYYVTCKDSLENAENINKQSFFSSDDGQDNVITNGMKVTSQGDQVVYNIKNNTIFSSFNYKEQFYVKEIAIKHNWKIEKETKKIGRFKCIRATTTFRGRNYTAWFTTEIPISYGPWKLYGLPGLILEAYDTNKNVYWYFKNVEYPTENKENVNNIRKGKGEKKVTFLTLKQFGLKLEEYIDKAYEGAVITAKKYNTYIPSRSEMPKAKDLFLEEIKQE